MSMVYKSLIGSTNIFSLSVGLGQAATRWSVLDTEV